MNPRVNLTGAYDLHIHAAPSIYPRYITDEEAAEQAREAGLAAIMLKCHFESTVSRARLVNKLVPEVSTYGGLVLNRYVGGLNIRLVETVLEQGGKQIWFPTMDSKEHSRIFGSVGSYGLASMGAREDAEKVSGISVVSEDGTLTSEASAIIELVREKKAIVGTCHLSREELHAVVQHAGAIGAKALITHPFFAVPNLSVEELRTLTDLGGIAELLAISAFNLPTAHQASLHRVKEAIDQIGPDKFIISSDGGQPFNPMPSEALRVYAESLFELGVPASDLRTMMVENPERMLSA